MSARRGISGLFSNTVGIMSMGLISVTLFYFGYRKGLEPLMKKHSSKKSEEFADFIYKQEVKQMQEDK